jgi:hypothetical protein
MMPELKAKRSANPRDQATLDPAKMLRVQET